MTLGAIVPIAARTAYPATLSVVTRRTLFATPQFNLPLQRTAEKTTTEKKAIKDKRAVPAKRGRPPKKPAVDQKKQPKQEKQRGTYARIVLHLARTHYFQVRIPENLKPPKRAPGPYFLFYSSFAKSQPQASSLQDFQEISKRAGEIWRGYSMTEKQVCMACQCSVFAIQPLPLITSVALL